MNDHIKGVREMYFFLREELNYIVKSFQKHYNRSLSLSNVFESKFDVKGH